MSHSLAHVIYYVENVPETVALFEKAFGLTKDFIDESGMYAQMKTGDCALGFVAHKHIKTIIPDYHDMLVKPFGCEIALTSDDVQASLDKAIQAGCELIFEPKAMPWGQTIAYAKTPQGILVELCTAMCPTE